jgi:hypothetical protein
MLSIVTAALASGLLSSSTCPPPGVVEFTVEISYDPVVVDATMPLSEISELAKRSGQGMQHPALGFYSALTEKFIQVHRAGSGDTCSDSVEISVQLKLAHRLIELGEELRSEPCLLTQATDHYMKHAEADADLFAAFARGVKLSVERHPLLLPRSVPDYEDEVSAIAATVDANVELQMEQLDAARLDARKRLDASPDARRLENACQSKIGMSRDSAPARALQ